MQRGTKCEYPHDRPEIVLRETQCRCRFGIDEVEGVAKGYRPDLGCVSFATYYVATNGTTSGNGQSSASPWSFSHAVSNVPPNSVVYVKAGDYGNSTVSLSTNDVQWIGYKTTPGDIISNNGPTFTKNQSKSATEMPLLSRSTITGSLLLIHGNDIVVENFQFTGSSNPVSIQATTNRVTVRNLIITEIGTQNVYETYDGYGLNNRGTDNIIENCFIRDCTGQGITSFGLNTTIRYNYVYATNAGNPMDYYILVFGSGTLDVSGSEIYNNYLERDQPLAHGGHGIDLKGEAQNCLVFNNEMFGTNLELAMPKCRNNTVTDNINRGYGKDSANWHSWVLIYNGAKDNIIKNQLIANNWAAINLANNSENLHNYSSERNSGGYDNTFENIVIKNVERVFNLNSSNPTGDPHGDTPDLGPVTAWRYLLKNFTVYNADKIFVGNVVLRDFELDNWIYSNSTGTAFETYGSYTYPSNGTAQNINPTYRNCKYYSSPNITFPSGWQSVSDPLFVNPSGNDADDFKVQSGSPLIDAGGSNGSTLDFAGNAANGTRDVGAWEFNGLNTTPINSSLLKKKQKDQVHSFWFAN